MNKEFPGPVRNFHIIILKTNGSKLNILYVVDVGPGHLWFQRWTDGVRAVKEGTWVGKLVISSVLIYCI